MDNANRVVISIDAGDGNVMMIETISQSTGSLKLKTAWKITDEKYVEEYKKGSPDSAGDQINGPIAVRSGTASTGSISDNPENETGKQKYSSQNTTQGNEDIRYSLSGIMETGEEWEGNDTVQGTVEQYASILEAGAELIRGQDVDTQTVRKSARDMKKEYYSSIDADEFASNLEKFFSYLQTQEKVNYRDMVLVMNEVAMPVVEQSQRVDPQQQEQYESFRKKFLVLFEEYIA